MTSPIDAPHALSYRVPVGNEPSKPHSFHRF